MDAKYVSITNLGVIESVDLTANRAGAASLVRNQGMILGDMTYGNGADKYYGANGVVSGRILGGNGGDLIVTGRADDSVRGGAGNETIVGSLGADTLDGGANTDLVSYVGSPEGITVDLRTGEASGGWAEGDQLIAVENLRGTAFADVIIGSTVANNLRGGNGADHLEGASGDETLRGDAGADTFSGGAVADCATYQGNLDSV